MLSLAVFLIVMIAIIAIGVPIAFAIAFGSLAMIGVCGLNNIPISMIAQRMYSGVDSFPLLAVPLFMLVGNLMERGGMSERLVKLISIFFGRIRGGLGMVAVAACMFFAGISGAANADALAVAGVMIPMMRAKKYPDEYSAGLIATAGTIGPIIPPSIPMVIYSCTCGVSVAKMFAGGMIPGVLIGVGMIIACYFEAKRYNIEKENLHFSKEEIWVAFKESFLTLLAPLLIIVSIMSGIFTATESAALACVYAFILGKFVYKELTWKVCKELVQSAMISSSAVMLIVGVSSYSSYIIARSQLAAKVAFFLQGITDSKLLIMLIFIVFLVFWGMIMDITPAIMLLMPIFMPVLDSFGIDYIYFGIIMIIVLCMGLVTPPVGTVLYTLSDFAKAKPLSVAKAAIPSMLIMLGVAILCACIPQLVLWLPTTFL